MSDLNSLTSDAGIDPVGQAGLGLGLGVVATGICPQAHVSAKTRKLGAAVDSQRVRTMQRRADRAANDSQSSSAKRAGVIPAYNPCGSGGKN